MSPQTHFQIRALLAEAILRLTSLTMLIQLIILLKIYKWTSLGPALFQQKVLAIKSTSYAMLQFAWIYEIWPCVKWLPLAILADAVIVRTVRNWKT